MYTYLLFIKRFSLETLWLILEKWIFLLITSQTKTDGRISKVIFFSLHFQPRRKSHRNATAYKTVTSHNDSDFHYMVDITTDKADNVYFVEIIPMVNGEFLFPDITVPYWDCNGNIDFQIDIDEDDDERFRNPNLFISEMIPLFSKVNLKQKQKSL